MLVVWGRGYGNITTAGGGCISGINRIGETELVEETAEGIEFAIGGSVSDVIFPTI